MERCLNDACGLCLAVCMVAGTYQGAYGCVAKAHVSGLLFKHPKGVGVHVTFNGQVAAAGRQVLPDSEHVDLVGAHIAHHFQYFLVCFAQADHQAAFGGDMREPCLEFLEQIQAEGIVCTRARLAIQAWHGFEVVVHHVGQGVLQNVQRFVVTAPKVGNQNFDLRAG